MPEAGALAATLYLTSTQTLLRSLVPMADACRGGAARADTTVPAAGLARATAPAGASRPELLCRRLLGAPPATAAGRWRRCRSCSARPGPGAGAGPSRPALPRALLLALPDLAYHARVFGSPWTPNPPEGSPALLAQYPGDAVGVAARRPAAPRSVSAFYGCRCSRASGPISGATCPGERAPRSALGATAVLLLDLSYRAVRLRDLLPLSRCWRCGWHGGVLALWRWADTVTARRALLYRLLAAPAGGADGRPLRLLAAREVGPSATYPPDSATPLRSLGELLPRTGRHRHRLEHRRRAALRRPRGGAAASWRAAEWHASARR